MAEYIECKALLNALKEERKNGNFVFTTKWIKEIMDNLPAADVVEVVRCQKCTEWDEIEGECSHWYGMRENCFCSCGERKEGAEE